MIPAILFKIVGLFGKGMQVQDKHRVKISDTFSDSPRILDLGGGGEGVIGILKNKQVVALDLVKSELEDTPDGPEKVVGDARNMPFENNSFDVVTSFYFLMYTKQQDHELIIKEAKRVQKIKHILKYGMQRYL